MPSLVLKLDIFTAIGVDWVRKQSLEGLLEPQTLFSRYIEDYPSVAQLYDFDPTKLTSFQQRQSWLTRNYQQDRSALVRVLTAYNRSLGCAEATEQNLSSLACQATLAVVTGQQAGVATGPLYTIYKAITTLQLARKMQTELGVPVVPVFWVASEDHDYQEINHINVLRGPVSKLDLQGKLVIKQPAVKKLTLTGYPVGKQPIGQLPVNEHSFALITSLAEYLPETADKQVLIGQLAETARASANLAEWFARLLTLLLGKYGLIIADPMLPDLRQLLIPFFQKAVAENPNITRALTLGEQALEQRGFPVAFPQEAGFTGLFTLQQGQRLPLINRAGQYWAGAQSNRWEEQALLDVITEHPEQFSTSAVLRPIAQDQLFPTLAYVGGPGEIAYFGQLQQVYRCFGQQMPIFFPRQSYTLVEPQVEQSLRQHKLNIQDVRQNFAQQVARIIQAEAGFPVDEFFSQTRERISAEHQRVVERMASLEPGLAQLAPGNLVRMLYQLEYLEKKTQQQLRKKYRTLVHELNLAALSLFPQGALQERTFNITVYLAGYGSIWLEQLVAEDLQLGYSHQAVFLERQPVEKTCIKGVSQRG